MDGIKEEEEGGWGEEKEQYGKFAFFLCGLFLTS